MLAPEGISKTSNPFYGQEYRVMGKVKVAKFIQSRPHWWSLIYMRLEQCPDQSRRVSVNNPLENIKAEKMCKWSSCMKFSHIVFTNSYPAFF